jgi:signal transduction histidine kinase/DNA-binding CsgD family transcriptional regulator
MKEPSLTSLAAVREEERRRLTHLLEQRLGAPLNLLLAQANAYHAALSPSAPQARKATQALAAMTARALADLHDLLADLHPGDLHDLGLVVALEALALRVERRYGLTITLDLPPNLPDGPALPPLLALATYRIAQEALHNAGQHAGAGRVGLSLRLEKHGLRLTIADDGEGFEPPQPLGALAVEGKRGLADVVEWAAAVGGRLEISPVLGVGTQVRVRLPLEPTGKESPSGVDDALIEPLTPREREVLAGVAAGLTNKQIAARLGISDRTVQFHLGNILGKLGVASRTEAAVLALQRGLV